MSVSFQNTQIFGSKPSVFFWSSKHISISRANIFTEHARFGNNASKRGKLKNSALYLLGTLLMARRGLRTLNARMMVR